MQHVDGVSAESHHLGVRIFLRPFAGVDVPSDRSDRSNSAQPGNYVWLPISPPWMICATPASLRA
jgi:hypothetical protein